MFAGIGLTVSGLLYLSIIAFSYFSKKRYVNVASNIFSLLIRSNIIFTLYEIICIICLYKIGDSNLDLCRLLTIIFISYGIFEFNLIYLYIKSNFTEVKYNSFIELFANNYVIFTFCLSVCAIFISFFTTFYIYDVKEATTIGGTIFVPINIVLIYGIIFLIKSFILDLKNNSNKKVATFIIMFLYISLIVFQVLLPRYMMISLLYNLIVVALYFLFESQDYQLVSELIETKRQTEIAYKERKEFLSKISHEVRTPMNTIIGLSENILDQAGHAPVLEVKQDMKNVYYSGKTLLDVVNNILLFSQLEAEKIVLEESDYAIIDIFNELSSYANSMIDKRRVSFVYDVNSSLPSRYYGDKNKISRILLNLLSNSIKYTNDGKITIALYSEKLEDDKVKLVFVIRDTGIGIKDNKLNVLFDNKDSDGIVGAGLGLVLTKKLVDFLNGDIKFESIEGSGTTFYVDIVQKVTSLEPIGDVNNLYLEKVDDFVYFDCSNYRMLVVDDNEIDLKVYDRLLKFYKIDLDLVNNGNDALKLYKKNHYDLIFVDHLMPEMETFKSLKKFKKKKLPPVVILTANVITELKDTYNKVGFSDYMSKPLDVNELNKIMKKYFYEKEVRK